MRRTISRILVPTDFSPPSEAALEYAFGLARSLGACMHLIHVLEEPFVTAAPYEFSLLENAERQEGRYQDARARLSRLGLPLSDGSTRVTIEVRRGTATESIVNAAIDYGAELIVMGTHGRSGLEHLLLGSVAERVIRNARCPVLTVRESGRDARDPVPATVPEDVEVAGPRRLARAGERGRPCPAALAH